MSDIVLNYVQTMRRPDKNNRSGLANQTGAE